MALPPWPRWSARRRSAAGRRAVATAAGRRREPVLRSGLRVPGPLLRPPAVALAAADRGGHPVAWRRGGGYRDHGAWAAGAGLVVDFGNEDKGE